MKSFLKNLSSIYKHTVLVTTAVVMLATASFGAALQVKNAAPAAAADAAVASYADRVVVRGYITIFNRKPEPAGRNYWYSQLVGNPNADWFVSAVTQSAEYRNGPLRAQSDSHFITTVYNRSMKRAPTQSEMTWWMTAFKHDRSSSRRAKMIAFMIENGFTYDLVRPEVECKGAGNVKKNNKPNSVMPICRNKTAGTTRDAVIVKVPESNFYVNKAWVKNITDLRFEAARAGHYLVATSSYRTYEEQTRLFNMYGYPRAAYPGTSMHEWGLAIDFRCAGRDGRVLPMTSNRACLDWMHQNAARFGVYNLSYEPWHWSSNGT